MLFGAGAQVADATAVRVDPRGMRSTAALIVDAETWLNVRRFRTLDEPADRAAPQPPVRGDGPAQAQLYPGVMRAP
jgi:hypothetical protein